MAKSFAAKLSDGTLRQLNLLIRSEKYANIDCVLEWLDEQGVCTSQSAVGRYCAKLKEADGYTGRAGSNRLLASIHESDAHLDELYKQYGKAEFKKRMLEKEILQQLIADDI